MKFGGDEPIPGPDRLNKDESMVRKLNLMVDVMHELPEFEEEQKVLFQLLSIVKTTSSDKVIRIVGTAWHE